jgi:hypothetical protein
MIRPCTLTSNDRRALESNFLQDELKRRQKNAGCFALACDLVDVEEKSQRVHRNKTHEFLQVAFPACCFDLSQATGMRWMERRGQRVQRRDEAAPSVSDASKRLLIR